MSTDGDWAGHEANRRSREADRASIAALSAERDQLRTENEQLKLAAQREILLAYEQHARTLGLASGEIVAVPRALRDRDAWEATVCREGKSDVWETAASRMWETWIGRVVCRPASSESGADQ